MTNLPTVSPKTTPAESGRSEMGNFFQMPGQPIGGNLSNADFDSFLGNRESSDQAEELREEQEVAKKRKKPVEAGLATAVPQVDTALTDNPEISSAPKSNPEAPEQENTESAPISNNPLEKSAPEKEVTPEEEEKFTASKEEVQTYSDPRGMESASSDVEMIASATSDAAESPVQPLREPSITTINRLTAFASLERTALAPVAGTGNSSESGIGNAANGLAMPTQSPKAQSPSAQAASLFKSLAPEMDKFKQTGASQIQLDLPVGEKESVRIKLSIRGGEIRSTFITESAELREALQKAWPEFSQNSRDRGFRMGDPAFQQSFQENNANLGQNNRRQSDTGFREASELFSPVTPRKPAPKTNPASNATTTALWA